MLEDKIIKAAAEELVRTEDMHTWTKKLTEKYPEMAIEDSYKIQAEVFRIKTERGERVIGKKIGLTSEGIRQQIGVYEPDFSLISDGNFLRNGEALDLDMMNIPRLEPELAFILKDDLKGPVVTNWEVVRSVLGVSAAFEIVDTRFKDYEFTICDTVADSASYGKIITDNKIVPLESLDLTNIGLSVYKNGKLVKTATSAEVMGNPVNSVVWLANKMIELGQYLKKGDIILSGSFTPVFELERGDYFEARFAGIGNIGLHVKA